MFRHFPNLTFWPDNTFVSKLLQDVFDFVFLLSFV